jgi:NADH-quinone oxidoreductase subunit N
MAQGWNDQLNDISGSISHFVPELILIAGMLLFILLALFKKTSVQWLTVLGLLCFTISLSVVSYEGLDLHQQLFGGMLKREGVSSYMKILIDVTGVLTCLLSFRATKQHPQEYFALLIAVVLGGHILIMSTNFIMIFLSMELISISSYVLAGYSFTKEGSEGSVKYFLFGSVTSAVMLYGFSFLYGITGTIDFASVHFFEQLMAKDSALALIAFVMVMAGFLYKIAAAPLHPWAPDVYEAAPIPVIAFLSVAPKLAGLTVLLKFVLAISLYGQSRYDWQLIMSIVAILTLAIGNFAALWQRNSKRMMAYSSIAQSGFLLVGVISFLPQGVHFMLFYASIYVIMNFLVFHYLNYFEKRGSTSIADFHGTGKRWLWASIFLLIGLISLTGLPPTAGFTGKLFVFTALWQAYEISGKPLLLWLLIFGLLNTVISLFYYLRIPYFAFIKSEVPAEKADIQRTTSAETTNNITFENLLGIILVIILLGLFFIPGLLMGWINKITFVF